MKPVYQTITEPGRGNCFSACLASILELSIDKVPNFRTDSSKWDYHEQITNWLARFGYMLLRVRMTDSEGESIDFPFHPLPDGAFCIASGKSPRGEFGHSVVAEIQYLVNYKLIHDPHPDGGGIEKLWTLDFLVPLDPAKTIKRYFAGD